MLAIWCVRGLTPWIWTINGSWPILVNWGGLEGLHRVPLHDRARKTALLLRGSFSIFLGEVPVLPTSPNVAKSPINLAKLREQI